MKKTKKIYIILLVILFSMLAWNSVKAASSSISASSSKVNKGSTVTVSASVNAGAWNLTLKGAGQSKGLVGQTSTTSNASASTSITFTASKVGTYKFDLIGDITDYYTENNTQKVNKSITITVTEPETNTGGSTGGNNSGGANGGNQGNNLGGSSSGNSGGSTSGSSNNKPTTTTQPPAEVKKSTDNTLSALSIAEGQISPEFNKDVKEYSLTVPYEVLELNVTATPNDSKAKVEIIGDKDLQEGENILTIRVTAEDGSVADYVVKVTKARIPLALKSLVIKYQNENGELVETALNPAFSFDVFEYSLEEMGYWVEKLSVEALPNIEGANIDVQGADSLQAGENTVTITAKIPKEVAEGEEPKEEIITYTIKLNKKPEPTTMERLSDWYNQNEEYVIIGALGVCIVFLFGLSIYIVVDHNKYKHIIARVKEENDFKSNKIFEKVSEEESEEKDNTKTGKRFK